MMNKACKIPAGNNEFAKKEFFEVYLLKQKELGKRQREYKQILSKKLKDRKETIMETSYENSIQQLRLDMNTLRAQIWVANGITHRQNNQRYLKNIQCHVACQERLASDIRTLKSEIVNLEKEICRVNKAVYEINRKTVPDSQHENYVRRVRKKMTILENQLEVGVRRECGFTAINASLREELIGVLNYRTFFNDTYTRLVQNLNSEKKYLIDLIEYALSTYDNCIDVYEKIDNLNKRQIKDGDLKKVEMQALMRDVASNIDKTSFISSKVKLRKLDDLQPKEYRRREQFRRKHTKKINLYNQILEKILLYTESQNVEHVIEKYQMQESLYYSYFNYANEMSYHMTLLNNSVNRLFGDINRLKSDNRDRLEKQLDIIRNLEDELLSKQKKNEELHKVRKASDERLDNLLTGIHGIFELSNADATPLKFLLGDNEVINLSNVQKFLKILESHIYELTATVYVYERKHGTPKPEYVVRQVEKFYDQPTDIDDIVLTQQCPECAEGEAFNVDDAADGGVIVNTIAQAKQNLYEKVNQPEMQYRLHSISHCRLPRCRILAAKRNI